MYLLFFLFICSFFFFFFFFQAEDGIRDLTVTGVQTCALPILSRHGLDRWCASAALCWRALHIDVAGFLPAKPLTLAAGDFRSEERRVGKECRSRWSAYH